MATMLDDLKAGMSSDVSSPWSAARLGDELKEAAKRVEKGVNTAKAAVADTFEDSKIAAERLLKRGQHAVEDGVEEAVYKIKRYPLSSLAIAFGVGITLGMLIPRLGRK